MVKDYSLAIYDYQDKKLCDLSNYNISIKGEAFDIALHHEVSGYKELSFTVPAKIRDLDGNLIDNFRLECIRNEHKVRLSFNDAKEEYVIKKVIKQRDDNGVVTYDVQCVDSAFERLTKSGLDLYFDGEIGTAEELLSKVLDGSDWSVGEVDDMMQDGEEKVRTLKGERSNRYSLIQEICSLFECYVNFNIDAKTVDLKEDIGLDRGVQFKYSKNLKHITQNLESNEVITKLWVEGGDNPDEGLTLIDSVNPTGENYILNFDYYINLGLMTSEQIAAIDKFELDATNINQQLKKLFQTASDLSLEMLTKKSERDALDIEKIAKEQTIEELDHEIKIERDNAAKQELINQRKALQNDVNVLTFNISNLDAAIKTLRTQLEDNEQNISTKLKAKDAASKSLEAVAGDFIKEGLYQNDNYMESTDLYKDSLASSKVLSYPRVSYDCNVLDLSRLTGFELESFGLGDKVYIIDETLGINTTGRITEIDYVLDNPSMTNIKIANYDTKFEDIFKKVIVASNIINSRKEIYDRAQAINADGTLNYDLLQKTFDSNMFQVKFGTNNKVVLDNFGITIEDLIDENKMVRINSGGIFITSDGGYSWKYALSGDGMSALNITSGLIDTKKLQIWNSSEPRFFWDSDGLVAYGYEDDQWIRFNRDGIYFTRDNGQTYHMKMSWDGLFILGDTYVFDDKGFALKDENYQALITPAGLLDTNNISRTDNVADGYPLIIRFYIDDQVNFVDKVYLRLTNENFRAYSTSAASGGGSTSGASSTSTTASGGGSTSGASSISTTASGGGSTSGEESVLGNDGCLWHPEGGVSFCHMPHTHAIRSHTHGMAHTHSIPSHKHGMAHTHSIPDHKHGMAHTHSIPDHKHGMAHTHSIPDHTHDIVYGLYEKKNTNNYVTIYVDGIQRATTSTKDASVNLSPWITTKGWHTIELRSTVLKRISAELFIKSYIQR